jgi:manganese/zinc/iron transport system permease protein
MNPYKGLGLLEFLKLFFLRLKLIFQPEKLVDDEIQIYLLICLGTSCLIVGLYLFLQKKLLIANSISHTILLGIVLMLFGIRLFSHQEVVFDHQFSLKMLLIPAVITAFLTQRLTLFFSQKLKFQEDVSIGVTFTFLFALAVFFVSFLGRNSHLGLEAVTGNLDAIDFQDLKTALNITFITALWIGVFSPYYTLFSFDEGFAQAINLKKGLFSFLLMVLCSLVLIVGFKSVGVVMVLAFMCFPLMTAKMIFNKIRQILFFGIFLNTFFAIFSVGISRSILTQFSIPVSTAGIYVTFATICFFIVWQLKQWDKKGLIVKKL